MVDFIETIVEGWFRSKGYFTFSNVKIGNREIDLLALKLEHNEVKEFIHAETQFSTNPIGFLGKSNAKKVDNITDFSDEFAEKKFFHKNILDGIKRYYDGEVKNVMILGKLKDETQLMTFEKKGIEIIFVKDILKDIIKRQRIEFSGELHRLKQLLEVLE